MKNDNICLIARNLRKQFIFKNNNELLIEIVGFYGIVLDRWNFTGISGMLWNYPQEDTPVISVNASFALGKQRFIIAHIIGHFLLGHGEVFCPENIFDTSSPLEEEANIFAAELLMPRHLFVKKISCNYTIDQLSDLFMVSKEIIKWRLSNLKNCN